MDLNLGTSLYRSDFLGLSLSALCYQAERRKAEQERQRKEEEEVPFQGWRGGGLDMEVFLSHGVPQIIQIAASDLPHPFLGERDNLTTLHLTMRKHGFPSRFSLQIMILNHLKHLKPFLACLKSC